MPPQILPSRKLETSPLCRRVLGRVRRVATAFPELEHEWIRVGLLRRNSPLHGMAIAWERPAFIAFNPRHALEDTFESTVAHELTHLLQWPRQDVPNGERACDLFSLARCGDRFVGPPGYLRLPPGARGEWPFWAPLATGWARAALYERSRGRRQYVVWWEDEFAQAVRRARAGPGASERRGGAPHVLRPFGAV